MTDLLHPNVSPTPGAYRARPFDAVEIDEHVDADRIWATILGVRDELERYENEADQKVTDAQQGERDAMEKYNRDEQEFVNADDARAALRRVIF